MILDIIIEHAQIHEIILGGSEGNLFAGKGEGGGGDEACFQ